jgi:hypothetical protein
MPNPSIMVNVSLAVIACLGAGVAFVFAKAKEPWERLVPVVPEPGAVPKVAAKTPEDDGAADGEEGAEAEEDAGSVDEASDDTHAADGAIVTVETATADATTKKGAS